MSDKQVTNAEMQNAEKQLSAAAVELFKQANTQFRAGLWQDAEHLYQLVAGLDPQFDFALLQIARCVLNRGDEMGARQAFERLLRAFPENFSGWLEAGNMCRKQGMIDQAMISYKRAVAVNPQRYEGHISLARLLEDNGQFDEAASEYHWGLVAGGAEKTRLIHWWMAKYRLERGDAARALESMRQALLVSRLEKAPLSDNERAEMQIDLGNVMMRLGMTDDAHRAFERASSATEEATLVRLAELSFRFNLWQEAQDVLKRNVELHPDSALAHWNLAHSYVESWQLEEALRELEKAEAIAPQSGALSMRASVAGRMGDVDQALALYRQLAEQEGPHSLMRSSAAMSALYSDQLSAQEVADLHVKLFAPLGQNARTVDSFKNDRSLNRRLKVGLISADFHHQHPVNIFMQPILARLNKQQFELTVYFTGVSYDDQTQLAKQRVSHWVEVTNWSDLQLARRIELDQIDILLDLSGHTNMHRMNLIAQRVAPIQATFLGYPCSTGVPNIDWMIADGVVAPVGHECLYSEKLMRLPNTVFCYSPEVDYPFPDYPQSCAERPLTFGSFNNLPKLTSHTVRLWAAVLKAVSGSRLLLKAPSFKDESAIKAFTERFVAEGIDPRRLAFRGPVGLSDMMAEYADVDIALDPVPYNGGTTTLQALWMGVPVVVKAGNHFVSRMGASFMSAASLEQWVAESDAEYVQIAKQMAADRQALLSLKRGLRQQLLNSPAWDIDRYAKDFVDCLNTMWAEFVAA